MRNFICALCRTFIFAAIVAFTQQALYAAEPVDWTVVNVLPGNVRLYGADAPTQNLVVLVGEHGVIRRSADQGAIWMYPASGVFATLRDVDMEPSGRGIAVGDSGVAVYSSDGGSTWQRGATPDMSSLRGVALLSQGNAVAVGAHGLVYMSENNGAHWQTRSSGTAATLHAVAADGETVCIAVGETGTVLVSYNQGAEWQSIAVPTTSTLLTLSIPSEGVWFVGGDNGQLYRTLDSGRTWSFCGINDMRLRFSKLHWFDQTRAFALGLWYPETAAQDPIVMYTNDGGATWAFVNNTALQHALCMYGAEVGYATGEQGLIRKIIPEQADDTLAYGTHQIAFAANRTYRDVVAGDPLHWVAVGSLVQFDVIPPQTEALIEYSNDGGIHWQRSTAHSIPGGGLPSDGKLRSVAAVDAQTFVAVGDSGRVLRSQDGGATWQRIDVSTNATLLNVDFYDADNGLVCSATTVYHTSDGGQNWKVVREFDGVGVQIAMVNASRWYVARQTVTVHDLYRTDNAGADWEYIEMQHYMANWFWVDETTAWGVAALADANSVGDQRNDFIVKTGNAGVLWEVQLDEARPPAAGLISVAFADPERGIAVGRGMKILRTNDGGETWIQDPSTSNDHNLMDVAYTEGTAVAVSHQGMMIRYSEALPTSVGEPSAGSVHSGAAITVWPNPTHGVAFVSLSSTWKAGGGTLKIFNALGVEVADISNEPALKETGAENVLELRTDTFAPGVYYLHYRNGMEWAVTPLVRIP